MNENKQIIIITTQEDLKQALAEALKEHQPKLELDFIEEKLSRVEASKFAEISLPTLAKWVSKGIFTLHGQGRKKYFIKSEIIAALSKTGNK
jgi:hypothetical protein